MIPSAVYNISWPNFLRMWVPSIRRKPKLMALLKVITTGLFENHQAFLTFKNDSTYKVSHNASIVSLQKVLNDYFDNGQRRIYIRNVRQVDSVRFYSTAVGRQLGFFSTAQNNQVPFNSSLDFNPELADFQVYLPTDLQPLNETELQGLIIKIKAQLDYYKLFAKKYELIWTDM